ncbi:DUF2085 domain-containing protein [Staphylospora marina]|uniref:DUF2085 domain-containing protein n=1 Tax=Staphylospora marina TaxID=2490858 RepID=UPI000F5BCBC4|nr:DUF2085 domain-containing protein [Staphylospora marina]
MIREMILIVPCHRRPDRCLHFRGKPMPICARCLSMLLGYLFILPLLFLPTLPWWWGLLLQIPMLIDGFTQKWGWRESTNVLRVVTGLLSGLGLSILVVWGARTLTAWILTVT